MTLDESARRLRRSILASVRESALVRNCQSTFAQARKNRVIQSRGTCADTVDSNAWMQFCGAGYSDSTKGFPIAGLLVMIPLMVSDSTSLCVSAPIGDGRAVESPCFGQP